ncbi:MAG: hypothetical protein ABT02_05580 [Comamonadaceae bacterium SCN 68-20]|jgi:uncharacterized protein YigA (DUF484 family)|nr:DUF484 family protein [Comamonadaceae bacterium]ODU60516.1 MAG: hypothetical protein ABT02_05580 [Comamonadaceae bacterium SCN 68-20]OJX14756.1 MAG: hypothetical protein BGO75_01330 [Burkholderiales bacterium 68-20]UJB65381.1 DUF484 family protein [Acidovorax sp. YS12]
MTSTTSSAPLPPLSEADIAEYLINTPEFFQRHAEVLGSITIASPHGARAVSLHERQTELLREKIKGLELRVMDMVRHGNENAAIAQKIHEWACTLARAIDPADLPQVAADGIQARFDVPQAALRVWGVAPQHQGAAFASGVSEDTRAFATSLTMPFCGPNLGFEATAWLPQPEVVQSMALLPLREGTIDSTTPAFGLLVLGSPDPQRFDATMGTEFLSRMAELASAALARLR